MASSDPLLLLKASIAASSLPQSTTSSDPASAATNSTDSLATATHLFFLSPIPLCIPLSSTTRFKSTTPDTDFVDLRSIFFAWLQKDVTVPEYIASAAELDSQLPDGQKVRNLVFVERIDLITWLESASEESDYIEPLKLPDGEIAGAAARAADVAGGAAVPTAGATGIGVTQTAPGGRPVKVIDARLQEIYNGERKMGDRNTVLRGIKPTDFSHVRKIAETLLGRNKRQQTATQNGRLGQQARGPSGQLPSRAASMLVKQPTPASKRSDPIILLSPSASSFLRLSNIKSFLTTGLFVPPDHPTLSTQTSTNLLHITRDLKSLDSKRAFRFIIVDSPEQFKPDYWARVVAVFTTGQTWQFRGYKWREPQELFGHVLGVYLGERGQNVPNEIRGWGSGVKTLSVDRWDERGHGTNVDSATRETRRWRDREVVEEFWRTLEGWMRGRGEWKRV